MTLSARSTLLSMFVFTLLIAPGCSGGHEGCRPNPSVTPDMAALNLPPPEGGKLCHAEPKFVMYEIPKDRSQLVTEYTDKLQKGGWKEVANPAGGSDDPSSIFYEKGGRKIMFRVAKCSRSSFADIFGSCSIVTFDDAGK